MTNFYLKLRFIIPAILLLFGLFVGYVSYKVQVRQTFAEIEEIFIAQATLSAKLVSFRIQTDFRRNNITAAYAELVSTATDPSVRRVALVNESNRIFYSNTFREGELAVAEPSLSGAVLLFEEAREKFGPVSAVKADGSGILIVAPFLLGIPADALLSRDSGLLIMEYDLTRWKNDAENAAFRQGLVVVGLMTGLCLLIAVFLHLIVSRRLSRLAAKTEQIAAQNFDNLDIDPWPDEIGALSRSVTLMAEDLRESVSRLSESEQRARIIMDNAPDGFVVTDRGGEIISVNIQARRMFSVCPGQMENQDIVAFLPGIGELLSDGKADRPTVTPPPNGGTSVFELVGRRFEGDDFPVEVAIGSLQGAGAEHHVIGIRDVTLQKAIENQLRQSQKMESVGQLTSGIAHDFNNLLNIILLNLDTLKMGDLAPSRQERSIEQAYLAAEKSAVLTKRLLAFSREERLEPQVVVLNDLLSEFSEMLLRVIDRSVEVEFTKEPELWACRLDVSMMEAAVLNMLINARDAMPDGGRITLTTSNIIFDESNQHPVDDLHGPYVALSIADTGTGMEQEVLDKIFDPFFTTKEVGQGSGLGMSMVYGFIRQSGGSIKVQSRMGHGTRITIYLPRCADGMSSEDAGAARGELLAHGSGAR